MAFPPQEFEKRKPYLDYEAKCEVYKQLKKQEYMSAFRSKPDLFGKDHEDKWADHIERVITTYNGEYAFNINPPPSEDFERFIAKLRIILDGVLDLLEWVFAVEPSPTGRLHIHGYIRLKVDQRDGPRLWPSDIKVHLHRQLTKGKLSKDPVMQPIPMNKECIVVKGIDDAKKWKRYMDKNQKDPAYQFHFYDKPEKVKNDKKK